MPLLWLLFFNFFPAFVKAICCLLFGTILKMSMCLKRKDIVYVDGSLVVLLPWTKTLQNSDDIFTIVIARSETVLFDPVSMYMDFVHKFPVPRHFHSNIKVKLLVYLSQFTSIISNHISVQLEFILIHIHHIRLGGGGYFVPIFKWVSGAVNKKSWYMEICSIPKISHI